ncbi:MAG: ferredoxin [Syntrophorhabdus sp. PtaU1.Bin153]|nr:MAG: ferredoxin [Syntrophorhabdus sp. PtaU1.Bin153]
MKVRRKIIEIDEELCNGCGQCAEACAEKAIQVVNGKAKLISETYCDGLAACLGECPVNALRIVEREADPFDADVIPHRSAGDETAEHGAGGPHIEAGPALPCGCPSTRMEMFSSPCDPANKPNVYENSGSALSHWPVQIRLVPPSAPFLHNAHLLVATDCTPVAYPRFHLDFIEGKTVLVGCPKFDDAEDYVDRFAKIFKVADIRSITTVVMEVPCCSKMPLILQQGMRKAGVQIPTEVVVVSTRGKILRREKRV